ncbi:MAG: hypothetical protein HY332_25345 [Chloroflexi bacterium]|nr:hypothetical protein [Chloroflexota bacterium]
MPTATEEQVPKPLTYALMYHFLWFVFFLLTVLMLEGVLLAAGRRDAAALLPPLALLVFAAIAAAGSLAAFSIRVQVLLGKMHREEAFDGAAAGSRAILVLVPAVLALWWALTRTVWRDAGWSQPVQMTVAVAQVELVVWWLSHLASVRGLARGRKKYLAGAGARGPAAPPPAMANTTAEAADTEDATALPAGRPPQGTPEARPTGRAAKLLSSPAKR